MNEQTSIGNGTTQGFGLRRKLFYTASILTGLITLTGASCTHLVTLASFNGTNGATPMGSLTADAAGNLFGTTQSGGTNGAGTVFEIEKTASGYATTPTTLVSFDGVNLALPAAGLYVDAAGNLFGTTGAGGDVYDDYSGAIFEIEKTATGYASTPTFLAALNYNSTGSIPDSALIADAAGNLFGTTATSLYNGGTVFELEKTATGYASAPTTLFIPPFTEGYDGNPDFTYVSSNLVFNAAGDLLVGTFTPADALVQRSDLATIVEIVKTATGYDSTPITLVSNSDPTGSIGAPTGLTIDATGNLFVTTAGSQNITISGSLTGTAGGGAFEIAKTATGYASTPSLLASFNGSNGAFPDSALIADAAGNLFGTTIAGGANGDGTVFEIAKTATGYASTPTTLITLGSSDGLLFGGGEVGILASTGGLTADVAGNLLGLTQGGGANNDGSVFEVTGAGFATK